MEIKMEWVLLAVGLIVGGGSGAGITFAFMKNKKPVVVETNKVVEKMVEVDLSLTETDLLKIPCSAEYIEAHGESLCREMFCRMNTRSGNQANSASQKECESISNLINSSLIIDTCKIEPKEGQTEEDIRAERENCIRVFEKRK